MMSEEETKEDPLASAWMSSLERHAQWIPDTAVKGCMVCGTKFTLLNRRHHCRRCGACVCAPCSSQRVPKELIQVREEKELPFQKSIDLIAKDTNLAYLRCCDKCASIVDAQLKAVFRGK